MHHLAIFTSPGPELKLIGSFVLRWYGILIAFSVLIGLNISKILAFYRGLNIKLINDLLPILVLFSIVGARLYYVAFKWGNYTGNNFWSHLNVIGVSIPIPTAIEIWGGGIAIHGAIIAGSISVFIFCRLKKQSFLNVLDVLLPSVALGQSIGRWGNFFNNEAFGIPTKLPWKLYIPYEARPDIFSENDFFHPTFLYESLWNFAVFIFLIFLFFIDIKKIARIPTGAISLLYLVLYSTGRFFIEGLRIDPLCLGGTAPFCEGGFRIAQIISFLFICLGCIGLIRLFKSKRYRPYPFQDLK